MKPGPIEFASHWLQPPPDWDRNKYGECGVLEIRERDGVMESAWYPSPEELAELAKGRPVILTIRSHEHPPVSLNVESSDAATFGSTFATAPMHASTIEGGGKT
jgi:hypothetical protein